MAITKTSLQALNIDQYGLDEIDNKILLTIIDKFRGGPVGISTIATAIGEDSGTVEEVYEPFLIMEGFDLDLYAIRNLLVIVEQNLLTNHLINEET